MAFADDGKGVLLHTADHSRHTFRFDSVFDETSEQGDVYEAAGRPVIAAALEGFNACLLAYGQTGSGKTFTMSGADATVATSITSGQAPEAAAAETAEATVSAAEESTSTSATSGAGEDGDKAGAAGGSKSSSLLGVIPRVARDLFDYAMDADESVEFRISVSMVEIYMERIRCLIDPSKSNLQVGEDPIKGVFLKGATAVDVVDEAEMMDVMRAGNENRAVAATGMNAGSSRSHSLFMVHLVKTDASKGESRSSRLYLVDLAGSETVNKTGVRGQQLEEAKKINQSLSALGNVIKALTDGTATHVPYRNSKLTRVLQECLGGNARTALIICCSPSIFNQVETLSTLRFGKRAKQIKNQAKVNRERSPEQMRRYIAQLEAELVALRAVTLAPQPSVLPSKPEVITADEDDEGTASAADGVATGDGDGATNGDIDTPEAARQDETSETETMASKEAAQSTIGGLSQAELARRNEMLVGNVKQLSSLLAEAATELAGLKGKLEEAEARRKEAVEERENVAAERDRLLAMADGDATADGTSGSGTKQEHSMDGGAFGDAEQEGRAKDTSPLERELEMLRATFQRAMEDNESLREQLRDAEMRDAEAEAALEEEAEGAAPSPLAGQGGAGGSPEPSAAAAAAVSAQHVWEVAFEQEEYLPSKGWLPVAPGALLDETTGSGDAGAASELPAARNWVLRAGDGLAGLPGGLDDVALPSRRWYWLGDWRVAHDGGQAALSAVPAPTGATGDASSSPVDGLPSNGARDGVPELSKPRRPGSLSLEADAAGWRYGESLGGLGTARQDPPRSVHGFRDKFRRRAWVRCRAELRFETIEDAASQVRVLSMAARRREAAAESLRRELEDTKATVAAYEGRLNTLLSRMADAVASGDVSRLQGSSSTGVLRVGSADGEGSLRGRTVRGGGRRRRQEQEAAGGMDASTPGTAATPTGPAASTGAGGGFFASMLRSLSRRFASPVVSVTPPRSVSPPPAAGPASAGLAPLSFASPAASPSPSRPLLPAVGSSSASSAAATGGPSSPASSSLRRSGPLAQSAPAQAAMSQLCQRCEAGDLKGLRLLLGLSPQAVAVSAEVAGECSALARTFASTSPGARPSPMPTLPPVPETSVVVTATRAEGSVPRRGCTAAGLPLNAVNRQGRSAPHFAAKAGAVAALEALRQAGSSVVSASDEDGRQAIHVAARAGAPGALVWLLRAGASPSALSKHRLTPLHEAVLGRAPAAARCLLAAGADALLADANGFTAAALCRRRAQPGVPEWEELLELLDGADLAPADDGRGTASTS